MADMISNNIVKIYDPTTGKEIPVTLDSTGNINSLFDKSSDGKYNIKKGSSGSLFGKLAAQNTEKDLSGKEIKGNLSDADIETAMKNDKDFKLEQDNSANTFKLTDKSTGENISFAKSFLADKAITDKIKTAIPDATPDQIDKLKNQSKQDLVGFSLYNNTDTKLTDAQKKELNTPEKIKERRLDDYLAVTKNVPESVQKQGPEAVKKYRDNTISILDTTGEFGPAYIKHVPDPENMDKHADGLKKLSDAAEKNQGCKFKNATLFNGFTADELNQKVVIPNEKLAKGEKVGEKGETLVMITHEGGTDYNGAFEDFYNSTNMSSKNYQASGKNCKFDESFLGHYDSILVIQPNNQNADTTLNKGLGKISSGLDKNAKVDFTTIAHSGGGDPFLSIPRDDKGNVDEQKMHFGTRDSKSMMDGTDFVSKTKQPYVDSMNKMFNQSKENGHVTRFIGQGCETDYLMKSINVGSSADVMNKDALPKFFGSTGCTVGGAYGLGFVKDAKGEPRLEYNYVQEIPVMDDTGTRTKSVYYNQVTETELSNSSAYLKDSTPEINDPNETIKDVNRQFSNGLNWNRGIRNSSSDRNSIDHSVYYEGKRYQFTTKDAN